MLFLLLPFQSHSQLCTDDQKDVWAEVENWWAKWKAKDNEGAFANVHKDYMGWNVEDVMPVDYEEWYQSTSRYDENIIDREYDIDPVRIVVKGNAAVVHYYYAFSVKFKDGEEIKNAQYKGKWTEFFIKEKGKWMLLGDMTTWDEN